MDYDYEICNQKKKEKAENKVANILSRQFEGRAQVMAISMPTSDWLQQL